MDLLHIIQGSHDFFRQGLIDFIRQILADLLAIGWDLDHGHGIGIKKLCLSDLPSPGHASQLPKHLKEVLVSNRSHSPCFLGELEALFGFNRLVESSLQARHFHQAPRRLV